MLQCQQCMDSHGQLDERRYISKGTWTTTFALHPTKIKASQRRRYSSESLEFTLTDLRILILSEVANDTFASNFLILVYEMRSVLNPFVSVCTFSLDTQYKLYPTTRLPIYRLASCDYVFPELSESTLAPGQQWNRELKKNWTAECQNPEVGITRKKSTSIPLGRAGLSEVNFQRKRRHTTFYVPVYAMYKLITST